MARYDYNTVSCSVLMFIYIYVYIRTQKMWNNRKQKRKIQFLNFVSTNVRIIHIYKIKLIEERELSWHFLWTLTMLFLLKKILWEPSSSIFLILLERRKASLLMVWHVAKSHLTRKRKRRSNLREREEGFVSLFQAFFLCLKRG